MNEAVQGKKTSLWKKWKRVSETIGNIQGRIILEVLYFSIFLIPGLIITVFSDKLRMKRNLKTWDEKEKQNIKNLKEALEQ